MSKEGMAALIAKAQTDEAFAQALAAGQSPQAMAAVASENGIDVTIEELSEAAADPTNDRDLTDSELEGATGGVVQFSVAIMCRF